VSSRFCVRSERIATPDGIRPGAIHVRDGRILSIAPHDDSVAGVQEYDAGELVVLPGLVDTHVHINDPGRADWEGFETATRAAAAGGITTLVDMPLNSIPPTTTVAGLEAKRRAAAERCAVDVAFWGGVVPGNRESLAPLARAGVRGFKCFLSPSGVDEFSHVSEEDLRQAMPVLTSLGLPLLAHAEWPAMLIDPQADAATGPRAYHAWLESRPPASEQAAIDVLIRLAGEFGTRIHIVHLATPDALPAIANARRGGIAVTVETCPHYLTFAAEDIADGATAFKCAPPIRQRRQREGLWAGLAEGAIDFIATDHSPAPPAIKHLSDGDFLRAWGGIASLQLSLPVVWTGMLARGLSMEHLTRWLAAHPARLAGLEGQKGAIAPGYDADLVVWDPDAEFTVDAAALYHRHPVTPYHGARLRGRVKTTFLRAQAIYHDDEIKGGPAGRLI
jgi:allantoinase